MIYFIIIAVVLLILLIVYLILLHNKLVKLEINIKKEYSNLDISLVKRSDLITKLVETVKAYMEHEKDLLTKIVELRYKAVDLKDEKEFFKAENEISKLLKEVLIIAENYPDLKASDNFINLQNELSRVEEDLANSRKLYNDAVLKYNNVYMIFPTKIFARLIGYKKHEFYEVEEQEKEMPEINL